MKRDDLRKLAAALIGTPEERARLEKEMFHRALDAELLEPLYDAALKKLSRGRKPKDPNLVAKVRAAMDQDKALTEQDALWIVSGLGPGPKPRPTPMLKRRAWRRIRAQYRRANK